MPVESKLEPTMPETSRELDGLIVALAQATSALGASVHPITCQSIADLLRRINSYYSNLIEGHKTQLADIDRAMKSDFSHDPAKRALQQESAAHVYVEQLIDLRLEASPTLNVCSREFLEWIHLEFYKRLPEEFHVIRSKAGREKAVIPGKTRQSDDVTVGRHLAPQAEDLPKLLDRFSQAYDPERLNPAERIKAAAASHHRLLWIHPFLDGNGRVARLFSHAYLQRAQLGGHGLWSVSRGLARSHQRYKGHLAAADAPRQGDYDGRGALTHKGLVAFCQFFLETALDQAEYMREALRLEDMEARMNHFIHAEGHKLHLQPNTLPLLREIYLRGEVPRGEAPRICGLSSRHVRRVIKPLLDHGLLWSKTERGHLRLGFPARAVDYWFPGLSS